MRISHDQIARILLRKHLRTATRLSFTPCHGTNLRMEQGIPGTMRAALANGHVYMAEQPRRSSECRVGR